MTHVLFFESSSIFGEHRLLVLLSLSFYLLEHYQNEIVDAEFKKNFLKVGYTSPNTVNKKRLILIGF